MVKIELWQIENSNPAPKFDIVVSPNEWAKTIKLSSGSKITDTKIQQLEFWNKFKEFVGTKDTKIKLRTPRPQHWYDVSIASSEAHISLTVNSRKNFISCDLYIDKNKDLFNFLSQNKIKIQEELNCDLNWWTANKASGIRIIKEVENVFDENLHEGNFDWLLVNINKIQEVFSKYYKEFKKQN